MSINPFNPVTGKNKSNITVVLLVISFLPFISTVVFANTFVGVYLFEGIPLELKDLYLGVELESDKHMKKFLAICICNFCSIAPIFFYYIQYFINKEKGLEKYRYSVKKFLLDKYPDFQYLKSRESVLLTKNNFANLYNPLEYNSQIYRLMSNTEAVYYLFSNVSMLVFLVFSAYFFIESIEFFIVVDMSFWFRLSIIMYVVTVFNLFYYSMKYIFVLFENEYSLTIDEYLNNIKVNKEKRFKLESYMKEVELLEVVRKMLEKNNVNSAEKIIEEKVKLYKSLRFFEEADELMRKFNELRI